ncbi:hypothetical protein ACSBR2_038690 [Camellia fascicularis]
MEEWRREGGWIPVFQRRQWRRSNVRLGMHTLFVDKIPESMDPKGLIYLFNNFGIIKDDFIPNKRRKTTQSRFGFVRYDCVVASQIAIQKANGIWCEDRSLIVKKAEFDKT